MWTFFFGIFFQAVGSRFSYIYIFQIKFIKFSFILSTFYSCFIQRNKFLFTKVLFPSCKAKDMFSSARHDGIAAIVFIAHVYFYMFLLLLKTLRYIQLYFIISKLDQNSLTISLIFIFSLSYNIQVSMNIIQNHKMLENIYIWIQCFSFKLICSVHKFIQNVFVIFIHTLDWKIFFYRTSYVHSSFLWNSSHFNQFHHQHLFIFFFFSTYFFGFSWRSCIIGVLHWVVWLQTAPFTEYMQYWAMQTSEAREY